MISLSTKSDNVLHLLQYDWLLYKNMCYLFQAAEAETMYKSCVAEANYRQKSLEKIKVCST